MEKTWQEINADYDRKDALLERCLEFLHINIYEIDISLLVEIEKELGKEPS